MYRHNSDLNIVVESIISYILGLFMLPFYFNQAYFCKIFMMMYDDICISQYYSKTKVKQNFSKTETNSFNVEKDHISRNIAIQT